MKKMFSACLAAGLALSLVGCDQPSGKDLALKECETLVTGEASGDKIDTSDLVPESFTDALYEAGITEERDHSETLYAVSGDVIVWNGSVEKRHTAICQITVENGEVTESSIIFV